MTSVGTSNYFLNNLVDYADRMEIEYSALTFAAEGGFTHDLRSRGISAYAVDCLKRSQYPGAIQALRSVIEHNKIDIVHTHLFEPTLVALIVAKLRSRKVVVTRHHSDALYRIPQTWKRSLCLGLERYINSAADRIIAPSKMVYEILTTREGVPLSKVSLIPYGQTLERFNALTPIQIKSVRDELGMDNSLALVCVARLHEEKGHRYLLQAFSELQRSGMKAKLYLVGAGPERLNLNALVQQMRLSQDVRILGWRDDALAVIAAADIIVHPSLQEALPSAVIEALILERPVIATNVSGVRDLLGENEHGIVVAPGDAEGIRSAIGEVANDLDTARERAQRGRLFVLQYMSAQRVAGEYMACYKEIMH